MQPVDRAQKIHQLLVDRFSIPGTSLYRQNSPARPDDRRYSDLWSYSGVLSALNALACLPVVGPRYWQPLRQALAGLDSYYDPSSGPPGFDSFPRSDGGGDKYYDDNEWVGLEYIRAFRTLKDPAYLAGAEEMLRFALSGWSEELGGGIYWRQNDRETKNTCSNAPAALLALLIYRETGLQEHLDWAVRILDWLQALRSPEHSVYWDSVARTGGIDRRTFTYNSGTMVHSYALLYAITGDSQHLEAARKLAEASYRHFALPEPAYGRLFYPATPWFNAVLLRGYLALFAVDPAMDRTYLDSFSMNLDFAWENARGADGLFSSDMSGQSGIKGPRRVLDQAAMVELYASLAAQNTAL